MLEASARLLRLLSLLQARRDWSGADLAARLEVTTRTIRADVDRLRRLGYPVHAAPGVAGGYRLGSGAALPPLLLDDEEAVAVVIGLRAAATQSVSGIEDSSLRALRKLEQVLPARLRQRVASLHTSVLTITDPGPTVDADVLTALAAACHAQERVRFDYRDYRGEVSARAVEPHRLVCWGRRWYLVGWDLRRDQWRTFRVDRVRPHPPTGLRFAPRTPPEGDFAAYVARTVGSATWAYRARVKVHASADHLLSKLPFATGVVEAIDERTSWFTCGSDSPHLLAVHLGMLDLDFDVHDAPQLARELRRMGERYRRATTAATTAPDAPSNPTSANTRGD
jgi:predicted DNA-binding transcriptional regulator YafY